MAQQRVLALAVLAAAFFAAPATATPTTLDTTSSEEDSLVSNGRRLHWGDPIFPGCKAWFEPSCKCWADAEADCVRKGGHLIDWVSYTDYTWQYYDVVGLNKSLSHKLQSCPAVCGQSPKPAINYWVGFKKDANGVFRSVRDNNVVMYTGVAKSYYDATPAFDWVNGKKVYFNTMLRTDQASCTSSQGGCPKGRAPYQKSFGYVSVWSKWFDGSHDNEFRDGAYGVTDSQDPSTKLPYVCQVCPKQSPPPAAKSPSPPTPPSPKSSPPPACSPPIKSPPPKSPPPKSPPPISPPPAKSPPPCVPTTLKWKKVDTCPKNDHSTTPCTGSGCCHGFCCTSSSRCPENTCVGNGLSTNETDTVTLDAKLNLYCNLYNPICLISGNDNCLGSVVCRPGNGCSSELCASVQGKECIVSCKNIFKFKACGPYVVPGNCSPPPAVSPSPSPPPPPSPSPPPPPSPSLSPPPPPSPVQTPVEASPPPIRASSPPSPPPPYICPRPEDTSPPCRFQKIFPDAPGLTNTVSKTFPLTGGAAGSTVTVSIGLSGTNTPNTAFKLSFTFNGAFTPVVGDTKISYLWFESLDVPGFGINPFLNWPGTGADDCGTDYNNGTSYLSSYAAIWGSTTEVVGYTSNPVPITYNTATKTASLTAPFADASFAPWNGASGPEMCCYQAEKGGQTALSIRIYSKANNNETAQVPCPADYLPISQGVFPFVMDCTCPRIAAARGAAGRRLMSV